MAVLALDTVDSVKLSWGLEIAQSQLGGPEARGGLQLSGGGLPANQVISSGLLAIYLLSDVTMLVKHL